MQIQRALQQAEGRQRQAISAVPRARHQWNRALRLWEKKVFAGSRMNELLELRQLRAEDLSTSESTTRGPLLVISGKIESGSLVDAIHRTRAGLTGEKGKFVGKDVVGPDI